MNVPRHVIVARERNRQAQLARVKAARERVRSRMHLDMIASMVLATMHTSEHIDVSLHVPTLTERGKPVSAASRRNARLDAITATTTAYAYQRSTRQQHVLYAVSGTREAQAENSSEIGMDTVAVTIMDGLLWIARNFKVRSMTNPGGGAAPIVPAQTYVFGPLSERTRTNIVTFLAGELEDGGIEVRGLRFLGTRPPPANKEQAASRHAEMQLLNMFRGRERGMKIGVSKKICPACKAVLDERGVQYRAGHVHSVVPKNWIPPEQIQTFVEARHRLD